MDFLVLFTTNDKHKALVEKLGQPGIDLIDIIREDHPALADININNMHVDTSCPINGHEREFYLDEEIVRDSKLFTGKTYVEVLVPVSFLSEFIYFRTKYTYIDYVLTKGLKICGITFTENTYEERIAGSNSSYTYDSKIIIAAWKKAGYPLKWGFKE